MLLCTWRLLLGRHRRSATAGEDWTFWFDMTNFALRIVALLEVIISVCRGGLGSDGHLAAQGVGTWKKSACSIVASRPSPSWLLSAIRTACTEYMSIGGPQGPSKLLPSKSLIAGGEPLPISLQPVSAKDVD
jgi:hypothetical protein